MPTPMIIEMICAGLHGLIAVATGRSSTRSSYASSRTTGSAARPSSYPSSFEYVLRNAMFLFLLRNAHPLVCLYPLTADYSRFVLHVRREERARVGCGHEIRNVL